ncbi:MAG TPA: hypothetical protein VGK24_05930 [Candidatus Angelobacter sp.]|jgi:hypothetical protein
MRKANPDTQLVELAGRNWLASELMQAGIEVARPERDRGIDLIAYLDRDVQAGKFIACPIQMKAAQQQVFSIDPKYAKTPGLVLAYVWNLGNESPTKCFALTYSEALAVARKMRYTRTASWRTGAGSRKRGYTTTRPSKDLQRLLVGYEMDAVKWMEKVKVSEETQRKAMRH